VLAECACAWYWLTGIWYVDHIDDAFGEHGKNRDFLSGCESPDVPGTAVANKDHDWIS